MKQRFILTIGILLSGCSFSWAQKFTIVNADGVKIKYEVTSAKDKTVQVTGGSRPDELIIPATVEHEGVTYQVTEIKRKAYFNRVRLGNNYMKRLVLPQGLLSIGDDAFHGALEKHNKASIYIPNSVYYIGSDAFTFEDGWGPSICDYQIENIPSFLTTSNCECIGISMKSVSIYYAQHPPTNTKPNQELYANNDPNTPPIAPIQPLKKPSSDVDVNIPQFSNGNENTFAVIFANENYQEEVKVDYAMNDGEIFKEYCNKVLELPEDNIHFRKDATLNNIKAEMSWVQKVADAYKGQARFIIYYAGHGIPDEANGTAYLLPTDGNGTMIETGYSLKQLYGQLSNIPSSGVFVFMDACFSGSKRGEGMLASARGVAIKAKSQAPQGKMVVFSAATSDETAYPFDKNEHGLFTYFLLKKLKDTSGRCSLGELGDYLTTQVTRHSIVVNSKSQTPCITASPSLQNTWRNLKLK